MPMCNLRVHGELLLSGGRVVTPLQQSEGHCSSKRHLVSRIAEKRRERLVSSDTALWISGCEGKKLRRVG